MMVVFHKDGCDSLPGLYFKMRLVFHNEACFTIKAVFHNEVCFTITPVLHNEVSISQRELYITMRLVLHKS